MPLPNWLARANRVGLNRVSVHIAPHLPGFGVVHHQGRKSGQQYHTPVNVFRHDGGLAIALTYGADSQWAKNVLAAGAADITTRGKKLHVVNPRVVDDPERKSVPAPVGLVLRGLKVDQFMLVDLAPDSS
jgi:deazaflavin-dependent oxidoreductase (nitroreductase family)